MRPVGFAFDPVTHSTDFTGEFHASGHAPEGDLLRLVERADAKIVIPVHSESPQRYGEALPGLAGRLVQVTEGRPIPVSHG
jgi:mRNA degradation ribonuclease J1/J2